MMKLRLLLVVLVSLVFVDGRIASTSDITIEECKPGYITSEDGLSCCPEPQDQDHTEYTCTPFKSDCWAICEDGYIFPDIQKKVQNIECVRGQWLSEGRLFSGNLCKRDATANESLAYPEGSAAPDLVSTSMAEDGSSMFGNRSSRAENDAPICGDVPRIKNAVLKCSSEEDVNSGSSSWTCVVTCNPNYVLPNGRTQLEYVHEDGIWKEKGTDQPSDVNSIQSCFRSMASDLPPELPEPEAFRDTGRKPNTGGCKAQEVPPDQTIGLAKIPNSRYGMCTNTEPLKGMVRCEGQCYSISNYNPGTSEIKLVSSQCLCCQAVTSQPVRVMMKCDKGSKATRGSVYIPTECECGPCTESQVITTTEEPLVSPIIGCPENHCD